MEAEEKNKKENNPTAENNSPTDRIFTPPPAQEIYPLEQSTNDGKHTPDHEQVKNESDD
jgi:hypothetical protein